MFKELAQKLSLNLKNSLAVIVLVLLIVVSIKVGYNLGMLVGFIILFVLIMFESIKRIVFDMNVKKIYGIEFEKEALMSEVRRQSLEIDPELRTDQIDTITEVALNQILGVANKAKYYEETVLYALKDLDVCYQHEFSGAVGRDAFMIDFIVELNGSKVIGIETVYSDQKFLSKEKIKKIIDAANTFKKADNLVGFLIITNAEVRPSNKETLINPEPLIEVVEKVVSPGAVLSSIQEYLLRFKE